MGADYPTLFAQLLRTPFQHIDLVWGIVPLYFGWLLNELTDRKANFKTALQTGFSFLWSGAHWGYQQVYSRPLWAVKINLISDAFVVNVAVTIGVLILGALAIVSVVRKRFPPGLSFLGHSRFSNYFMITIFPIQAGEIKWGWNYVVAILIFAVPIWMLMHFALKPWRK